MNRRERDSSSSSTGRSSNREEPTRQTERGGGNAPAMYDPISSESSQMHGIQNDKRNSDQ